jgi:hypothetical protein
MGERRGERGVGGKHCPRGFFSVTASVGFVSDQIVLPCQLQFLDTLYDRVRQWYVVQPLSSVQELVRTGLMRRTAHNAAAHHTAHGKLRHSYSMLASIP